MIEIAPLVGGTFSAQLIPQVSELLSSNGFMKTAIGAFAVVSGPGSFTGLRIGLAAVKALAEVLHKPIAAVSLLEVCVFASGAQGKIMAVLDAGRTDVYVGEYEIPGAAGSLSRERILSRKRIPFPSCRIEGRDSRFCSRRSRCCRWLERLNASGDFCGGCRASGVAQDSIRPYRGARAVGGELHPPQRCRDAREDRFVTCAFDQQIAPIFRQ